MHYLVHPDLVRWVEVTARQMRAITAPVEAIRHQFEQSLPFTSAQLADYRKIQVLFDDLNGMGNAGVVPSSLQKRAPGRPSRRDEIRGEYDALFEEERERFNTDTKLFAELKRKIIAKTGDPRGLGRDAMRAALRARRNYM